MKKVTLGDVCNKAGSNIAQKDLQENEGKYPIYGASGLIKKVDFYQQELPYIAVVKDGAGIGRTMLLPGHSSVIGTVQYILPIDRETVDLKYLYYAIVHMNLSKYFSGATIPHIYYKDYKKEPLRLPELEKQREIAIVFQRIDELIAKREQQLKGLDELVKSRFIEMFGTLHNNENGFDIVTLDEVCSLIKDGTHQTPQYTENRIEGYKFLSSKDVMSQKIDWTDIKYIPEELHKKLYAVIRPQRNDILMSKNGVNYGVAAVNDTDEIFDIYVSLALLRPKAVIDPVFLRCIINNPETKKQFSASIKGIGVPNLHLGEIKKTKIFLPPMELQKEFVAFVAQTDKSKYYNFTSYKYCVLAAKLIRQEWMLCQTSLGYNQ